MKIVIVKIGIQILFLQLFVFDLGIVNKFVDFLKVSKFFVRKVEVLFNVVLIEILKK